MDINELYRRFAKIREEQGDEAFESAVRDYAEKAIESGEFPGLPEEMVTEFRTDQAAYKEAVAKKRAASDAQAENLKNTAPTEVDAATLNLIQQSLPGLKSQAQFNAFMASFDAFKGLMNALFTQNTIAEAEYRKALDTSFEAVKKMTDLTVKLSDVPEAAESKLAEEFKTAPRQFGEYDVQKELFAELEAITELDELTRWWASNRQRIDQVVSASLRNPLIDAVRTKKATLSALKGT